ncbi:TPA: RepB family plasmid replication initiator protein [Salmonella enterica]|nr:RepB family plasmid replication initiator protein [Salmonella enterica]EBG4516803.1 RepB family plasmid replication initiator protein [Salmonella enterica]EBP3183685.1 RepB family plasmid replication initiator protein [Salmonella enterica]ECG8601216.1 RepB family plasmid replication initiator protein [Salmonella enterica subsp. salamae]HAF5852892.1 RepB family plasmid replication initiator protein [Salmonella enterica]
MTIIMSIVCYRHALGIDMGKGEVAVIKKNNVLMQANALTQAKYDLSRDQQRILVMCLDSIAKNNWPKDGIFRINHEEYMKVFGISEKEAREDIIRALKGFKGKELTIHETWDNVDELIIRDMVWVTSRWVGEKRGIYQIKLNSDLREFMVPLAYDHSFTVYRLGHIAKTSSKYSMRLLQSLSQFRDTGIFSIKLDVLRKRWTLPDSYQGFGLLRTRVLEPAIKDLRKLPEFSTLTMETRKESTGKVTSVIFQFTPFP